MAIPIRKGSHMTVARFLAFLLVIAILVPLGGCHTPRPDPDPDRATEPLTVYWPALNVENPDRAQP